MRHPSARGWVVALLVLMILFVSWLDWTTGPGKEPGDLYDVPILLAAGVLGLPGALVTAGASSVLYCLTLWSHRVQYSVADVSQVLIFFVLGVLVAQLVTEYLREDELRRELVHLNAQLSQRVAEAVAAEREAQRKLQDGQRLKMLGQAAAVIAHEIKNPLVSIGGFTSRAQRQLNPDHPAQSGLKTVVQEVTRLEALLKELLDLGSPGCRESRGIDVGMLVNEVLSLAQPLIQEREVQVESVVAVETLTTTGDADHLKRALLNVVLNGVEAMPEGGKLVLTVQSASRGGERGASIVIQDTGKGIPSECMPRIFEPFYTTKRGGTGLGLAVVKQTIDAHGGTVEVESSPREGTAVTIWLPLREAGYYLTSNRGSLQTAERAE